MARIRTIKPEFPHSESMGNVSRDSRLTFILLWTLADDEGRLRGNSRMLASLLFPYDDDAPKLIDVWLKELEKENCICRYKVEDQSYVEIRKWLIHQKIDKPSKSKMPCSEGAEIIFSNPRELSSEDQGSRIKDQGPKKGAHLPGCFEEFYSIYPKKVAKQDAAKAWEKINPSEELKNKIIVSLRQSMKSPDWTKDNGQFIPHPATWLNGKRWEDAPLLTSVSTEKPEGWVDPRWKGAK